SRDDPRGSIALRPRSLGSVEPARSRIGPGRVLSPRTRSRRVEGGLPEMSVAVLDRPTLVLNRNWQPVNVATVARALVMLWNESARVVDPDDFRLYDWADWARLKPRDDEPLIRAVTFSMRVPEVVTLTKYDRYRESTVTFSRRNIFKRDH